MPHFTGKSLSILFVHSIVCFKNLIELSDEFCFEAWGACFVKGDAKCINFFKSNGDMPALITEIAELRCTIDLLADDRDR